VSLAAASARGLLVLVPAALLLSAPAIAASPGARRAGAHATRALAAVQSDAHGSPVGPRAPTVPPLSTPGALAEDREGDAGSSVQANADPLVSNGLGSPLCRGGLGEGGLSTEAERNCGTSGFIASAAPTANYGLDVHIDTGILGLSAGGLDSAVQDVLINPVWMALVWAVHALCVMLEWCFTLDLLDSSAAGGLGAGLRAMQSALTQPWLATVLSIACVLVLYDGLVRRRVAQTLGEALLMLVMIVGGMWAIADPTGTVGALGRWANQASLGTLAVAARGTPAAPPRALGASMQSVFAAAIEGPWCYLEFGNVSWCRDTARVDPALRAAGLKIATSELTAAGCGTGAARVASPATTCTGTSGAQGAAVLHSAELLREARSNGAIFLALAPNGPARNSINDEGSLLRTLCGTSEATNCRGPTAGEAEFRTGGQTMARMTGLLLIALGALGMVLLLGFIAIRLLGAALFSLLYLLIAPGIVLAPALGYGGRAIFRRWLTQLLGAVVAKLLFSFLLGVVLAVLAILAGLQALGWWTQWLLMSTFWWGAFLRRHHALGLAEGAFGAARSPGPTRQRRSVAGRLGDALETRKGWAAASWARGKLRSGSAPHVERRTEPAPSPPRAPSTAAADAGERAPAARSREGLGEDSARLEQLERVTREQARAQHEGDFRRAAELRVRAERVEGELADVPIPGGSGEHSSDVRVSPAPGARGGRAYSAAGAGAAGRRELEYLDPVRRREARLEIDREIERQRELNEAVGARAPLEPAPARRPRASPVAEGGPDVGTGGVDAPARPSRESTVMRDAREVEAGRKRQLGTHNP